MGYFAQLDDYATYSGDEFDFHYDYNANSGGGQAFLGGCYLSEEGTRSAPSSIQGRKASIVLCYRNEQGVNVEVNLGTSDKSCYSVVPRASGSNHMKLSMKGGEARPSVVVAASLMLPETCSVNRSTNTDITPLASNNYWLQSMWLRCVDAGKGKVNLVPRDLIFAGGFNKEKGLGQVQFFKLDYESRIHDILWLAKNRNLLRENLREPIAKFASILNGDESFDLVLCQDLTQSVMRDAARYYPTIATGIDDPLPALMSVASANGASAKATATESSIKQHRISNDDLSRALLYSGAPGTGKSFGLNKLATQYFTRKNIRRITFYADYTNAQFMGCYKPYSERLKNGDSRIVYKYLPGPFLDVYLNARLNPNENFLLVVEELNRANAVATFGDAFQLIDRDSTGWSEYEIAVPEEVRDYFIEHASTSCNEDQIRELEDEGFFTTMQLPPNMFIWATMNSGDQGVYPMDTAFTRRWDFKYVGINEGEEVIRGTLITLGCLGERPKQVEWNDLRRAINRLLLANRAKEDMLIGPFFIRPGQCTPEEFSEAFKEKVLRYLFSNALGTRVPAFFDFGSNDCTYEVLCELFDKNGEGIFKGLEPIACSLDAAPSNSENKQEYARG